MKVEVRDPVTKSVYWAVETIGSFSNGDLVWRPLPSVKTIKEAIEEAKKDMAGKVGCLYFILKMEKVVEC